MSLCSQSDTGLLKSVVIKHAKDAFVNEDYLSRHWKELNYTEKPEYKKAVEEYKAFTGLLENFGIEIHYLPQDTDTGMDSIYARDGSIASNKGMILCNMGKAQRQTEPVAQEEFFREINLPVHGAILGEGTVEGGDVAWINSRTLAVARGYRTNDEGIRQLRKLLIDCIDELIVVPLPHYKGKDDVFHLMSILSPLTEDVALVYSPLMPVPFRENLLSRGIKLVEVPDSEFEKMGCNVLSVGDGKCIAIEGNPVTRKRIEGAGVEVFTYKGDEISLKGAGGPTCLTRPVVRELT